MVDPEEKSYSKRRDLEHLTKKCPECFTHLPLHAQVCTSCHTKVGDVNKMGFAEKPVDWLGYLLALVTMVGFGIFMWWAFFREGS